MAQFEAELSRTLLDLSRAGRDNLYMEESW